MKNTITLEQFQLLDKLAVEYQDSLLPDREEDFVELFLLSAEGESTSDLETAVMAEIEVYDWNGKTDFGTISQMLIKAGVKFDFNSLLSPFEVNALEREEYWQPVPHFGDGSATWQNRYVRCFSVSLLLNKNE
jgi:hypothetical protein